MPEMARSDRERGMTLIELMVATTLLGMIILPLTAAFVIALNTNRATTQRVSDTSGASLLASVVSSDIQSADVIQTTGYTCGSSTTFLELGWTDANPAAPVVTHVIYNLIPAASSTSDPQIVRKTYSVTGPSTCTFTGQSVLVRAADAGTPPTVKCDAAPPPCAATTRQVSVTVTALSRLLPGTSRSYYGPYTYTVSGTRRVAP